MALPEALFTLQVIKRKAREADQFFKVELILSSGSTMEATMEATTEAAMEVAMSLPQKIL